MTIKLKQNSPTKDCFAQGLSPKDCHHFQISTEIEGKSSCLECGLVQEQVSNYEYVRSITHYKSLLEQKKSVPPINSLVGETLKNQVIKFKSRVNIKHKKTKIHRPKDALPEGCFYTQYLQFYRDNQDKVLPKKERKRPIIKIYGDHLRLVLEWCSVLQSKML